MAEHKGAIKIDTKIDTNNIKNQFKEINTKTKNMINQFNRSVDSIRGQELALDKVNRKLEEERFILEGLQNAYNKGPNTDWETAQKLDEQKLKVQDLTAQYELMSSKLAESKKQTNELGKSIEENLHKKADLLGIQNGIDNVGKKLDKFKNRMTRLVGTVMVFSLLRKGLTSLRNKFTELLKTNDEYNSSLNQIKANLMTAFAPIYNACLPAINSLMSALSKLTGTIAIFVSGLFGKSLKQAKDEAKGLSKSLDKTAQSGEKASDSLSSIDEIQNIDDDKSSGGGSSGDSGIDYSGELQYSQKLLDILNNIKKWVEDNKGLVIGAIAGITSALILMKLLGLDPILSLGIGFIIAGIIALIIDFKAYLEDPSWENFGKIIRDIGLIILGVGIIIGSVPVIIAGVIAIIVGLVIQNWDTIKGVLQGAWNWIDEKLKWMEDNLGIFGKVLGSLIRQIVTDGLNIFKGLFTGLKQILDGIIMMFKGDLKNGIATAMKGIGNMIISVLNTIILGLNTFLTPFRAAITAIGSITGKKWNMSNIKIPSIPRLATGAVIPPKSEFMAVLGDQKRGVNIETPLSTMLEAFNKALDNRDGGLTTDLLIELNRNISELAERPIKFYINGKDLAQATYQDFQNEGNRLNYSTAIKVK